MQEVKRKDVKPGQRFIHAGRTYTALDVSGIPRHVIAPQYLYSVDGEHNLRWTDEPHTEVTLERHTLLLGDLKPEEIFSFKSSGDKSCLYLGGLRYFSLDTHRVFNHMPATTEVLV